jgi:hypothetical protein
MGTISKSEISRISGELDTAVAAFGAAAHGGHRYL